MYVIVRIAVALIISSLGTQISAQTSYNISITVEDADNDDGKMFIALYNTETNFLNKAFKATQNDIKNKQCTITFENIPEGNYAVSIFHDENDNGKLDTNVFGIPKEDYGCSNNAKGFMGPPKWEDAKFELKENKSILITL